MPPNHLPSAQTIELWPQFTLERPIKILVSGCLAGMRVGYDGSTYGAHPHIAKLLDLPNVQAIPFCPEDYSFGTPRAVCDIHGGTGYDVLDGRASVIASDGRDWTDGMIAAAHRMLGLARRSGIHLAILMDISAACGSQVIYDGPRSNGVYQAAQGVCAALLIRNGIPVVSQRDFRTLHAIGRKLNSTAPDRDDVVDHHESAWYRSYFG